MLLWISFAALTAVVLTFLLLPVMRRGKPAHARSSYDLNVYRDQLVELERDEDSGLIGSSEAQGARAEISRRMLSVKEDNGQSETDGRAQKSWPAIVAGMAIVPIIAVAGYLFAGTPGYPDVPRSARIASAVESGDLPALVVKVENHLAANPKDVQGWLVLAPVYRRLGRFNDAANAFGRAIELNEHTPKLYTDFGETLVLANNGLVISDARQAFDEALKLDSSFVKARYYLAVAAAQDGDKAKAMGVFSGLLKSAPANAPWRAAVEKQIAELQGKDSAPGPDQAQVAAAQQMTAAERQTMIRNMVNGLAQRLKDNGKDLEGWLRLINARMVLGEQDRAAEALKSAREEFKSDEAALARLANTAGKHGLN